ncbi:hypothetical protein ABT097_28085 [Streptomyces sp. NPDC002225]|uniref:hypothetical protein n=1 Tax=Streptomyces sp. NPDC002225 TaxID=3154413 RepID=UPI003329A838
MNTTRRITAMGVTLGALASVGLAVAPNASATSFNGCVYPRVCFYLTDADWNRGTPTAAYQDVTTSYQSLSSRALGAAWVVNTRNDDRAYFRVEVAGTTQYICLPPNYHTSFSIKEIVNGIRIDTAATC